MTDEREESKRPGLTKLAERLQRENPHVRATEILCRAKVLYTSPMVYRPGFGMVQNPDYEARRDR